MSHRKSIFGLAVVSVIMDDLSLGRTYTAGGCEVCVVLWPVTCPLAHSLKVSVFPSVCISHAPRPCIMDARTVTPRVRHPPRVPQLYLYPGTEASKAAAAPGARGARTVPQPSPSVPLMTGAYENGAAMAPSARTIRFVL